MTQSREFKRVLIVGVGLIGGSLASALKRKGFKGTVLGVDSPTVLKIAQERRLLDEIYTSEQLEQAVGSADLIFLCTPILEILTLLQNIGKCVKPNTLVTDVGSTKRRIVETANLHLPAHCDFIGGHPMAGSEARGIEAADPFLFENTTYVLTPTRNVHATVRTAFGELLELIGAKVLLLLPTLHDEIAAAVSHLPQMAAVALMNMVAGKQSESPHFLKMAAGGFRDMTRIASSPYGIWENILETNADMITHFIDLYIEELKHVRDFLTNQKLSSYFEMAARNRLSIPKDTKGFLRPQFDISVAVQDRPGMIAQIASICAKEGLNIKDIEVLKIRENEGGTIRLSFSSEEDRTKALALLRKEGLECRAR
jgi:prephenate dehydrogenase